MDFFDVFFCIFYIMIDNNYCNEIGSFFCSILYYSVNSVGLLMVFGILIKLFIIKIIINKINNIVVFIKL